MNYELAKQLKDVGFKQKFDEVVYRDGSREPILPTLSELIEACGKKKTGTFGNEEKFLLWFSGEVWCAGYFTYGDNLYVDDYPNHEEGSTPEEAVSRLWLELNKK